MISDEPFVRDAALHALFLSKRPWKMPGLCSLTGCDRREMKEVLRDMRTRGLIAQVEGGGWVFRADAAEAAEAGKRLRQHAATDSAVWHIGFLEENVWVEHIDGLLAFLDEQLKNGDAAAALCLELTVQFFLRLGAALAREPDPHQGRKFLENVILVQLLCFSNKLHREEATRISPLYYEIKLAFGAEVFPMYMDMVKKFTDFTLSKGSIARELTRSLMPLNAENGNPNLFALLGENPYVAAFRKAFGAMESGDGSAETQLINVLVTGLSHIAMHMRNFAVSEHISRSLLKLYASDQKTAGNAFSLVWLSHYCFVLLRQGKLDEALEHIDLLVNCLDTNKDALSYASGARGLALYHLFCGRLQQAHTVLTRASEFAMKRSIPHAPFLDPMNFDMLFLFEQQGLPPVLRYELDPTIEGVLTQGSQLMQGTALRIKALRLRTRGAEPRQVARLLEASKEKFHPERDVREMVLTLHELANTLCLVGAYAEAHQYRKIIAAHAGRDITPDIPYLELAFIATCLPVDGRDAHEDGIGGREFEGVETAGAAYAFGDFEMGAVERITAEPGGEIVGEGMCAVLRAAEGAAKSSASVLIQGETGVGKELVARHIHASSGRNGAFVAIHPASTSETLFESEFFGHERGAFTGATTARKGFFEEADGGSLFIDEVGDIPPILQTKLLRVLQERRFMRVGSNRPIASDFRLIAATNKDIRAEVEKGLFRADLMFRVAVIPLIIPPLRERPGDILPLARFHLTRFHSLYGKKPYSLTADHESALIRYHWPGNVRELKNLMERVAIEGRFTSDFFLYGERVIDQPSGCEPMFDGLPGLEQVERRYLHHVLTRTGGRVRGPDGAAAVLGMKVSTLYAKLRRLGILAVRC